MINYSLFSGPVCYSVNGFINLSFIMISYGLFRGLILRFDLGIKLQQLNQAGIGLSHVLISFELLRASTCDFTCQPNLALMQLENSFY